MSVSAAAAVTMPSPRLLCIVLSLGRKLRLDRQGIEAQCLLAMMVKEMHVYDELICCNLFAAAAG
jgi:hypothetical protein